MKYRAIIILILWMAIASTAWSAIMTELEPKMVNVGDHVRLTLTYDPSITHGMPDLTPLQKDFDVLATEQSMSYAVYSGQARSMGQWSIVLQPRKTGILLIPAIRMGHQASSPMQLTVNAAPTSSGQTSPHEQATQNTRVGDDVKLAVEANVLTPYLHQEVIYTVRLISRLQLVNVRYRHPHVDDAILFPLGEGQQYQMTQGNDLYHVDEQQYAIFPQKSGPLHITPPSLDALIYVTIPKQVSVRARPLTLQVKPMPKQSASNLWLPSKWVRLRESYDQDATTFDQGTTLKRVLRLQAQGLVAKLLPSFPIESDTQFSVYPGKADMKNAVRQGELWGEVTQSISYVLSKPGVVHLPAIQMPWFNVKTQSYEMVQLPSKTIRVIARSTPPAPSTTPSTSSTQSALPVVTSASFFRGSVLTYVFYGITILGIGLIGWLGLRFARRHRCRARPNALILIEEACHANDPVKARAALLLWAQVHWPMHPCLDLADIRALVRDEALQTQLSLLDIALYQACSVTQPWTGDALWSALRAWKQLPAAARVKKRPQSSLPPIYPQ